jgi:photosystem II stability/assembly factor-like uncharacterized protein
MKPQASTRHWTRRATVIIVAMVIVASYGQQRSLGEGFGLKWLAGRCPDCKIAVGLAQLQFTTAAEGWATGCNFGPEGTGDYVVVHTADGGRTWKELPQTYQHAGSPALSFPTPEDGWITWWNPADLPSMIRTVDGGKHWDMASGIYLRTVRFFDSAHGIGAEGATFYKTESGGRAWKSAQIPNVRRIDRLFFLSRETGWVAGTDGRDLLVFRTVDGGTTWNEARTPAPSRIDDVADLYFLNSQRGWLITWHADNAGTYLFTTNNGGNSWARDSDASIQGPHRWARVVRFLSEQTGFVFETDEARSLMIVTHDGGASWRAEALSHPVYDCQLLGGDLRCSAGGAPTGFNVLSVHPN